MKKLALAITLALAAGQASAMSAFLVSCNAGTSVTGRSIWVGTYQYGGQQFQQSFTNYCPYTIEVQ